MPVPTSGRQTSLGSIRRTDSAGYQNTGVEVLPRPSLGSFDGRASDARPGGLENAVCRGMGPDFFFPSSNLGFANASRICARCPAADKCLATALDDPSVHGNWAGTSARERQYMRNEEGLGWG
jgi:WhiB family redox-sensing transcriptional regulator